MIIRLSHPWRWHKTRDLLDTTAGDVDEATARKLIRRGFAKDVADLIIGGAGGWVTVELRSGPTKIRGYAKAIAALRQDAGQ